MASSQARKAGKSEKVIKLDNKKDTNTFASKGYDPDELIFALDIGTRTVVGIVGLEDNGKFRVLDAEIIEHKNRAMLDGQIHDIAQVSDAARIVKENLEKRLGVVLNKVAIAAAGRVLKTCEIKIERDIEEGREIEQELVGSIEMEGIQKAQIKLDEEIGKDERTQYYCVGYSVINYYLNGYVISSLLGHKGKKIGVDVLATFLPHIVVDSLYTVMIRIGLEVVSLTLEPIAAINVTIPKDLRLLNLALVDIGAGTSDIAITRDGSVVAYAMAPVAGDEITEKIAQHYLVDFKTGEKIKVSLTGRRETVAFTDILGKKYNVRTSEVAEVIAPSVESLAATIVEKILEYNHKSPNAVFLIGGGSRIPGLTNIIAKMLNLPCDRVVIRGRDIIQNIRYEGKKLSGPESITPLGIAVTAHVQRGQDFLSVTLNGKKIRLFNSKKLTIADALILVGFDPGQLIGRTGKSLSFSLNGEKKIIRGEHGKPAEIYVNELQASLDTVLRPGDSIRVVPADNGRNASARLFEYTGKPGTETVFFNETEVKIGNLIYLNGKVANDDSDISEGDSIMIQKIETVADMFELTGTSPENMDINVNGRQAGTDYVLDSGDKIEFVIKKKDLVAKTAEQLEISGAEKDCENCSIEGEPVGEPNVGIGISEIDRGNSFCVVINGKETLLHGSKTQYIFVDVFNYIEFDLTKPKGTIVLKLNGRQASFTDVVKPGDIIEIYWN